MPHSAASSFTAASSSSASTKSTSALHSYRSSILASCLLPPWVHARMPTSLMTSLTTGTFCNPSSSSSSDPPLLSPPVIHRRKELKSYDIVAQEVEQEKKEEDERKKEQKKRRTRGEGLRNAQAMVRNAAGEAANEKTNNITAPSHSTHYHGLRDLRKRELTSQYQEGNIYPYLDSNSSGGKQTEEKQSSVTSSRQTSQSTLSNTTKATVRDRAFLEEQARRKEALITKERIEIWKRDDSAPTAADSTSSSHPQLPRMIHTDGSLIISSLYEETETSNRLAESKRAGLREGNRRRNRRMVEEMILGGKLKVKGTEDVPSLSLASLLSTPSAAVPNSSQSARTLTTTPSSISSISISSSSPPSSTADAHVIATLMHETELALANSKLAKQQAMSASTRRVVASESQLSVPSSTFLHSRTLSQSSRHHDSTSSLHSLASSSPFMLSASASSASLQTAEMVQLQPFAASSSSTTVHSHQPLLPQPAQPPPPTQPPILLKLRGIQPGITETQIRTIFQSLGVKLRRIRIMNQSEHTGGIKIICEYWPGGEGAVIATVNPSMASSSSASSVVSYALSSLSSTQHQLLTTLTRRRLKRLIYERIYALQGSISDARLLREQTRQHNSNAPAFVGLDTSSSYTDRRARILSKVAIDMNVKERLYTLMAETPVLNSVKHRVNKKELIEHTEEVKQHDRLLIEQRKLEMKHRKKLKRREQKKRLRERLIHHGRIMSNDGDMIQLDQNSQEKHGGKTAINDLLAASSSDSESDSSFGHEEEEQDETDLFASNISHELSTMFAMEHAEKLAREAKKAMEEKEKEKEERWKRREMRRSMREEASLHDIQEATAEDASPQRRHSTVTTPSSKQQQQQQQMLQITSHLSPTSASRKTVSSSTSVASSRIPSSVSSPKLSPSSSQKALSPRGAAKQPLQPQQTQQHSKQKPSRSSKERAIFEQAKANIVRDAEQESQEEQERIEEQDKLKQLLVHVRDEDSDSDDDTSSATSASPSLSSPSSSIGVPVDIREDQHINDSDDNSDPVHSDTDFEPEIAEVDPQIEKYQLKHYLNQQRSSTFSPYYEKSGGSNPTSILTSVPPKHHQSRSGEFYTQQTMQRKSLTSPPNAARR